MNTIESQIEALTQELSPRYNGESFYWFDPATLSVRVDNKPYPEYDSQSRTKWKEFNFASTNKEEVEEYADCYKRLKLYQLIGEKTEKEFPIDWSNWDQIKYSTWFFIDDTAQEEDEQGIQSSNIRYACLAGVWFARNEDRLEALKICGIDKAFQEKCAKYGLGGA